MHKLNFTFFHVASKELLTTLHSNNLLFKNSFIKNKLKIKRNEIYKTFFCGCCRYNFGKFLK